MIECKEISAMLPRSWKKACDSGTIIPTKMRFCNECSIEKTCDECNNHISENKEFEAILNELKRHPPNKFGQMLPFYKI